MKKGQVLGLVSAVTAVGTLVFLLAPASDNADSDAPSGGRGDIAESTVAPRSGSGASVLKASFEPPLHQPTAALRAVVEEALQSSRALYEPRAQITQEETVLLMSDRKTAAERVEGAVAGLPADEVGGVHAALRATSSSREKLTLLRGLGAHPAEQAVEVLEASYAEQDVFRIREEILRTLGDSTAPGHIELALQVMFGEGPGPADPRLMQIAAQSLYGEAGALDALERLLSSDAPVAVKLEAIHSIGGIRSGAARRVLERVLASPNTAERVRQYVERELQR